MRDGFYPDSPLVNSGNAPYRIEVGLKNGAADPAAARALALLRLAGVVSLKTVRRSKIYSIRGPFTLSQIHQAAKELLCDGVTEDYKIASIQPPVAGAKSWRAEVWIKSEIADPTEQSLIAAFECAKLPRPASARSGWVYYIECRAARETLEKIMSRWLAVPRVYRISLAEAA